MSKYSPFGPNLEAWTEEAECVEDPLLLNGEDRESSTTLLLGLLFLAIQGLHALHSACQHGGIEPPPPHGRSLVSNQLVFVSLPAVGFNALVTEAWVIPPPITRKGGTFHGRFIGESWRV